MDGSVDAMDLRTVIGGRSGICKICICHSAWHNGGALVRTGEVKPSYRGEAGTLEGVGE